MKQYLNDVTDHQCKQLAEINRISCITGGGFDKVKFVDPHSQIAGDLGINYRKEYIDAPVYSSEGTGTLDETKWYSIILVPVSTLIVDPNSGEFLRGPSNHWADPVQPSVASKSLIFTLPSDEPTDTLSFYAGNLTASTGAIVEDTEQVFAVDGLIGYTLLNVETGITSEIISNDETTITTTDDLLFDVDDRYQIIKARITDYYVYACELTDQALVVGATWVYQGVTSVDSTSFELSDYIAIGTPLLDIYYPPESQRSCTESDGKLFLGGGVFDDTGEAVVDVYAESFQAAVVAGNTISFSEQFETALVYGESVLSKIMRVTLPTSSAGIQKCQIGSIVTISNTEDAGNSVSDLLITNVADDGSWFDIVNNDGVANTDDETATVSMYRNVLVGNTSGDGKTNFTQGMVNARFQFASDAKSYGIRWVDEITQTIGLTEAYDGLSTLEVVDDNEPDYSIDLVRDPSVSGIGECMFGSGVIDLTTTPDFTISFWRRKVSDNTTTHTLMLLGDDSAGNYSGLSLYYSESNQRYSMIWNDPLDTGNWDSDSLPANNEWHHYTVVCESGSSIKLFLDGEELTRTSNIVSDAWLLTESNTNLKLNAFGMSASVAKIKIHGSALSDADVMENYLGKTVSGILKEWIGNENSGDLYAETGGGVDLDYCDDEYGVITTKTPAVWGDYTQTVVIENDVGIEIGRDRGVSWSDQDQPHIFRTENYTPISDKVYGVESFNGMLLVFCENSLYRILLQGLGQTPSLISEHVSCVATNGKAVTPIGVFFYDGAGISMTDGQQVVPVTAYRAQSYMSSMNNNQAQNIRAVYDPNFRRVEFSFPFGSEAENNYGLMISIDSLNCYPVYRNNVNSMWLQRNEFGDLKVNHGTTARIGDGRIFEHSADEGTDGEFPVELSGIMYSIDGNVVVTDFGTTLNGDGTEDDPTLVAGDLLCMLPHGGAKYRQVMISDITRSETQVDGSNYYDITIDDEADISDINSGDTAIAGGIPFDYGVKWTDFGSPKYKKHVRQLHLDITNFNGIIYIEHYKDLHNRGPFRGSVHYINADTTKIISQIKSGDLYHYGFRIYGVSLTQHSFHSFEILYDLEQ